MRYIQPDLDKTVQVFAVHEITSLLNELENLPFVGCRHADDLVQSWISVDWRQVVALGHWLQGLAQHPRKPLTVKRQGLARAEQLPVVLGVQRLERNVEVEDVGDLGATKRFQNTGHDKAGRTAGRFELVARNQRERKSFG